MVNLYFSLFLQCLSRNVGWDLIAISAQLIVRCRLLVER